MNKFKVIFTAEKIYIADNLDKAQEIAESDLNRMANPLKAKKSSSISSDHRIVKAAIKLGKKTYGSPTLSDQAALNCPSLKLGPGDSKRSHIADEFIYLDEIEEGINFYIKLLEQIL